jgi:hypothetical protein
VLPRILRLLAGQIPASVITSKAANDYHFKTGQLSSRSGTSLFYSAQSLASYKPIDPNRWAYSHNGIFAETAKKDDSSPLPTTNVRWAGLTRLLPSLTESKLHRIPRLKGIDQVVIFAAMTSPSGRVSRNNFANALLKRRNCFWCHFYSSKVQVQVAIATFATK